MLLATKCYISVSVQILGTLIKKYNHGITCVVRIIQVYMHTYMQINSSTFNCIIWRLYVLTSVRGITASEVMRRVGESYSDWCNSHGQVLWLQWSDQGGDERDRAERAER